MKRALSIFLWFGSHIVFSQFGPEKIIIGSADAPLGINGFVNLDVNSDSLIDLITISQVNDEVALFINDGTNKIPHKTVIDPNCDGPRFICNGDLDNDNDQDLVVVSQSDLKANIYWNDGTGVFVKEVLVTSLLNPLNCSLADLNQDGYLDLLIADQTADKILMIENLGSGNFSPQQVITSLTNGAIFVTTADMDLDGDLDIISASTVDDKVAWYENLGFAVFGPQQIITTSLDFPKFISISDIDNDGDFDLIVTSNGGTGSILNNGFGTFAAPQMINTSGLVSNPPCIFLSDFNSDLLPDLVTVGTVQNSVYVFENTGSGSFNVAHMISNTLDNSNFVQCVDYNYDGIIDIVASGSGSARVEWYENYGGFNFSDNNIITTVINGSSSVVAAKINDDNYPDLITAGKFDDNISISFQLSNNEFQQQVSIFEELAGAESIDLADFDGDGDLDFVAVGDYINLVWFENLGNGLISDTNLISNNDVSSWSVVAGDVDGDGDHDVITSTAGFQQILWYENDGFGNFISEHIIASSITGVRGLYLGDLDNDADLDLVSATNSDNKIARYENLGGGNFGPQIVVSSSVNNPQSVYINDLNNDGLLDIASASMNDNKVAWYQNLGGVFSAQNIISTSAVGAFFIRGADLDLDGDVDLISSNYNDNSVDWYENLGSGTFATHLAGNSSGQPKESQTSDIDLDGDLDIVNALSGINGIGWFENLLLHPNQARGRVFYDENQNGVFDSLDYGFDIFQILTNPLNAYAFTYSDGRYFLNFNDTINGLYEVYPGSIPYWSITSDSLLFHVLVDSSFNYIDSLDFGLYPDTLINQISTELTVSGSGCSQTEIFWINIQNTGTTNPSGIIHFILDTNCIYAGSSVPPDSVVNNNYYWSYDTLNFYESQVFGIWAEVPNFTYAGDTLWSFVTSYIIGDTNFQLIDSIDQIISCAYDPNDKIGYPYGIDSLGFIPHNTEYIDYTIRFQNTGTDTAFNIVIKDQLDQNLNWGSIVPLGFSAPVGINCSESGLLTFSFQNIMLPDSNVNEPLSHGFIKYRVYLNENLSIGTSILNNSSIYFDFNPAIITNTTIHTLFDCDLPLQQTNFPIFSCISQPYLTIIPTYSFVDVNWNINSLFFGTNDTINWFADAVGISDLNISIEAPYCLYDTLISINVLDIFPIQASEQMQICSGDSIIYYGHYYSAEGTYIDTVQALITGCDSLVEMNLQFYPNEGVYDLGQTEICQGDSALFEGIFYHSSGLYTDTLQNQFGCDSIIQFELIINQNPIVNILTTNNDTLCIYNDTINIISTPVGGILSGNGVSGNTFYPEFSGLGSHVIVYIFQDSYGCYGSDTINLVVDGCLNLYESEMIGLTFYPNPLGNLLYISNVSMDLGEYHLEFYDILGKLVLSTNWDISEIIVIETGNWNSGQYFAHLFSQDSRTPILVVPLVK